MQNPKIQNMLKEYYDFLFLNPLTKNEVIRVFRGKTNIPGLPFTECFSFEDYNKTINTYKKHFNLFNGISIYDKSKSKTESVLKRNVIYFDIDNKTKDPYYVPNIIKKIYPGLEIGICIDSGNGYHYYIPIEEESNIDKLVELTKVLIKKFKSDPKANLKTQLSRIPTTYNKKDTTNDKPVKIIFNNINKPDFKRYSLSEIERIITHPVEYASRQKWECVKKMELEGAKKHQRNYCYGRLMFYYRDILNLNHDQVFEKIKKFNSICNPPKDDKTFISEFEGLWNKHYKFASCNPDNAAHNEILKSFCTDCCSNQNKTIDYSFPPTKYYPLSRYFIESQKIKKLTGTQLVIYL